MVRVLFVSVVLLFFVFFASYYYFARQRLLNFAFFTDRESNLRPCIDQCLEKLSTYWIPYQSIIGKEESNEEIVGTKRQRLRTELLVMTLVLAGYIGYKKLHKRLEKTLTIPGPTAVPHSYTTPKTDRKVDLCKMQRQKLDKKEIIGPIPSLSSMVAKSDLWQDKDTRCCPKMNKVFRPDYFYTNYDQYPKLYEDFQLTRTSNRLFSSLNLAVRGNSTGDILENPVKDTSSDQTEVSESQYSTHSTDNLDWFEPMSNHLIPSQNSAFRPVTSNGNKSTPGYIMDNSNKSTVDDRSGDEVSEIIPSSIDGDLRLLMRRFSIRRLQSRSLFPVYSKMNLTKTLLLATLGSCKSMTEKSGDDDEIDEDSEEIEKITFWIELCEVCVERLNILEVELTEEKSEMTDGDRNKLVMLIQYILGKAEPNDILTRQCLDQVLYQKVDGLQSGTCFACTERIYEGGDEID